MRILAIAVLPLALAVSACDTMSNNPYGQSGYPPAPYPGPEPYPPQGYPPQPYPPQSYPEPGYPAPVPGAYRAQGTEPFWDLTIGRDMVFTDRGNGLVVSQPTPQVIVGVAGEIYRTQRLEVNIVHARCNDGMSDRALSDTVQVYVDGRLYRGCGGGDAQAPIPPVPSVGGGGAPAASTHAVEGGWRIKTARTRARGKYLLEVRPPPVERQILVATGFGAGLHPNRPHSGTRGKHLPPHGLFPHRLGKPRSGGPHHVIEMGFLCAKQNRVTQ